MRRLVGWGETAHVFLGAALALPPTMLVWAFVTTSLRMPPTPTNIVLVLALAVLAVVGIVAVACAPPVRTVEIATARTLLGLDLPDPVITRTLAPRLLGATWCALVALVGGTVLFALLYFVPFGIGLLAFPFTGEEVFVLPGGIGPYTVGAGLSTAWLIAPGIGCLALALGFLAGGARMLRRLAPRFLGPTDADRIECAQRGERDAARANALARDLHDSVGHALTAMTLQASAARVTLTRDPDTALRSIAAIEDTGRTALGELDAMLGVLRGHLAPAESTHPNPSLTDLIEVACRDTGLDARVDLDPADLPPGVYAELTRITQEALTNAARHGARPARLLLTRDAVGVRLEVVNPVLPATAAQRGGRGLVGIRERALLLGGRAEAGSVDAQWRLVVRLPVASLLDGREGLEPPRAAPRRAEQTP